MREFALLGYQRNDVIRSVGEIVAQYRDRRGHLVSLSTEHHFALILTSSSGW